MNNFRMYVPTDIRFGKNRLNELPEVLEPYGKRVLLAYGGGSIKRFGLYDKVVDLLESNGFHIVELTGIEPNPKIDSVREGVKLIREHALDVILAVGGGSVVDAAKVIAGGVYYDGDAWDLVEDSSKMGKAVPIVDILTLAATGTEMNRNAVISNPERNEKLGTSGWELLPKVSFLDPTNTFTVPASQTAAGAADILSHLFEQYFNHTAGVDVQDNIAEGLMKAVIQHAPTAIQTPDDYIARANILWASTLALNGIPGNGRAGGWTCHPIEHELSAYYDITHGIGLAILTPRWMAYCLNHDATTIPKFAKYARNVWHLEGDDEIIAHQAVKATHDFLKSLGIPMTLPEVGITTDELVSDMSAQAVQHGHLTQSAYVALENDDVAEIIRASFEEMTDF
ncbi:iron-containing alcohol dehydrogenase [Lactococcus laudensis]|uniref:Iron-containing alcohol dehydrogenase n=1 Tax=Pseudolactococcus laudensis TaxID=1494461 RepID=A0A7V8SKG2_9LACT|nr:iron-containing alcohol dehydrogenase [Lactococcus laudensis]MBA0017353.1 iron-containing alcohol dehydrogenase [Lactococcus laudensis]MBW9282120.1 iron-containing alcohol dehydrogenase [Lactococcus laudensis]